MAEQCVSLRENEMAVQHYKEALKYSPDDILILAALARLLMQVISHMITDIHSF